MKKRTQWPVAVVAGFTILSLLYVGSIGPANWRLDDETMELVYWPIWRALEMTPIEKYPRLWIAIGNYVEIWKPAHP